MLNAIISDVNNATLEELNLAHGLILFKGHKKDKSSDRSYRTISSCPFLAKSLDLYLHDLYHDLWDNCQAETQYQGTGSSHELAALLVTEVVQHSLHVANKPIFLLALDAQSAFDRCLRQILCCELFKAGVNGSAIQIIDKRLASRSTVYEWSGELMGPSQDDTGFEQGGINSSDFYKLYNNEQLKTAQYSCLGVHLGTTTVSAIGQADDVFLVSNDIDSLHLLVKLTEIYCAKYRVKLVPSKTKLLAYATQNQTLLVDHAKLINRVTINGVPVPFVTEAEHVGVIRNTIGGNLPNIAHRILAHKKAMGAVLSAGLARNHRGNPAASLRVHQQYGTSVLLSGLSSLVLSTQELQILELHFKNTVQNLQCLHDKIPRSLVFLLAGSLPAEAILNRNQLTLFSMVCGMPDNPLNLHARKVFISAAPSANSWFQQIAKLCLQYHLPHPLTLLDQPPGRDAFKRLVKRNITDFWEDKLRQEASNLPSLCYLNPYLYTLSIPHPVWTTSTSSSFECTKSTVIAKMISGRYRSEEMCKYWSNNRNGYCLADTCSQVVGNLEHILVLCPALEAVRSRLRNMWLSKTIQLPALHCLLRRVLSAPPASQVQFILDPWTSEEIVQLWEVYGQPLLEHVFYLCRTFAYYIHRQKLILLGRWPGAANKVNCPNNVSKSLISGPTLLSTLKPSNPPPTSTPHHYQSIPVPILTRSASTVCDGPATCSQKLSKQHQSACLIDVPGQECTGGVGGVRPVALLHN